MKKITSALAFAALALPVFAQQDALNAQFGDGIPSSFTLRNFDGMGFEPRSIGSEALLYFSGITPEKTWFTGDIDDGFGVENTAALSASRRDQKDKATNNWLITPKIAIQPGYLLRWDARSVHRGFPERYALLISTSDSDDPSDFQLLAQYDDETYGWSTHVVSLEQFAGKSVRIAFVHNSTNRYLLAIDNLRVGPLSDRKLTATNFTSHFPGNVGTLPVDLRIFNYGREIGIRKVYVEIDGAEAAASHLDPFTMPRASYIDLSIPLTVEPGRQYSYTVKALLDTDAEIELAKDAIWCGDFPRTPVAEKYTGTWCTSCTRLTPLCQRLEQHFGDDMIVVEPHFDYTGADDMTNATYGGGIGSPLSYSEYPTMYYNRNERATQNPLKPHDTTRLLAALNQPVRAAISLQAVDFGQPGLARLVSYVTFGEDTDNSAGNIRLGYAAIQKHRASESRQGNGVVRLGTQFSEFHILPGTIPADALIHDNVPVGECFPTGVTGSLPQEMLTAGKTYVSTKVIEFPDDIPADNLYFVSYLLDSGSPYQMLNAAADRQIKSEQLPCLIDLPERLQAGSDAPVSVTSEQPLQLSWSSSDESIASVADGRLSALVPGVVTITAADGDKTVTKSVTVYGSEPQSILETYVPQPGDFSSVEGIDAPKAVAVISGSLLRVSAPGAFTARVTGTDGITVASLSGDSEASLSLDALRPGLYLIEIEHSGITETYKAILR